jgi:D-xylose 1-dehydrogenase (NADP+, D-xylono-1,5-lactone-forming)
MTTVNAARPIRLALVGLGWISPWHGRAAIAASDVELVACCDIREARATEFAAEYGCKAAYTDYEKMLREHDLDAVLLATWPPQHLEQIHACLEAGIRNILCEKSLAFGSDMASQIWAAAQDAEALIMEGLMWRHHPAVRQIEELVAAGEIGELDYINATFDEFDAQDVAPDDPNRDWRKRPEAAGGVPWDVSCYCVDACNHFAGSLPRQAMAVTGKNPKYGTVDRVHGIVEYENERVAHIASSLRTNFNYDVKLNGSAGSILLPNAWRIDDASEFYVSHSPEMFSWTTTPRSVSRADAYLVQMERFVAAVRGNEAPDPTLSESVVNSLTLDALLQSGEERAPVTIEIPADVRAAHPTRTLAVPNA